MLCTLFRGKLAGPTSLARDTQPEACQWAFKFGQPLAIMNQVKLEVRGRRRPSSSLAL